MMTILTSARWYLAVLIFISLVTTNVEHLFMCLLAIYIFSSEKCLFRYAAHFSIGFVAIVDDVVKLHELFVYFKNQALVGHVIY